jgi:hypothetical protein
VSTTDEELEQKRQHVEKLRNQLADEQAKRTERENGLVNDVTATQLDAEASRLEAALAAAKEANKVAAVKQGADAPLTAAKEDLANAEAHAKAEDARREEQAKMVAEAKAADNENQER